MDVFLSRHDLRRRERHVDALIGVLEELGAERLRDADDGEEPVTHGDPLAQGIIVAEELIGRVGPEHQSVPCADFIRLIQHTTAINRDTLIFIKRRLAAHDLRGRLLTAVRHVAVHEDHGSDGRDGRDARSVHVVHGETVKSRTLLAAPAFLDARKNHHAVRAEGSTPAQGSIPRRSRQLRSSERRNRRR